jgi:sRNA-binding protein
MNEQTEESNMDNTHNTRKEKQSGNQRVIRTAQAKKFLKKLSLEHSKVFHPKNPLPLQIRGREVILNLYSNEYSEKIISVALRIWTSMLSYVNAVATSTHRYDLEGNAVEEITEDHQSSAKERVRELLKLNEKRKEKALKKNVFLGNLPENINKEEIRQAFSQIEGIKKISLPKHVDTKKRKGYGFIKFESQEQAEKALLLDKKIVLDSNTIRVKSGYLNEEKKIQNQLNSIWKSNAEKDESK